MSVLGSVGKITQLREKDKIARTERERETERKRQSDTKKKIQKKDIDRLHEGKKKREGVGKREKERERDGSVSVWDASPTSHIVKGVTGDKRGGEAESEKTLSMINSPESTLCHYTCTLTPTLISYSDCQI